MERERPIRGEVLGEELELRLNEVCEVCGASEELVIELVREGVVEPSGPDPAQWVFSGFAVTRIRTALRLHRDLEINLPGAALALELLDEIERLRRRIG